MRSREEIVKALESYCKQKGSQNKAAATMKGVSSATISQMLNGNWDLITERMWQSVEGYVFTVLSDWQVGETRTFKELTTLMSAAQKESLVMSATGEPGTGKSFAAKIYEKEHKNVYRIACSEYWSKNDFIDELLRVSGMEKNALGYKKSMKIMYALSGLRTKENPLIILDEFDKLNDSCWYLFITLYNELEDRCGIITLSTNYIDKRIRTGLRRNKKGYKEIWSRLGNTCIELSGVGMEDIKKVCEANGVSEQGVIDDITDKSCGDLRKAKKRIYNAKR